MAARVPAHRLIVERSPEALRAAARDACPQTGFCSRSYRDPYALVAGHEKRIGVDIERVDPASAQVRAFAMSIATVDEREACASHFDDPVYVASLWSSKEALSKALGDALRYDPRRLESPLMWPDRAAGPWRAVEVTDLPAGHVGWLVWEA